MSFQDRSPDVQIEIITDSSDLKPAYEVAQSCFGKQTNDGFWQAVTPGGDSPEGIAGGVERMKRRFDNITKNKDDQPNLIFLRAVIPENGKDKTVGFAIWWQLSSINGYGDKPPTDFGVEELAPNNPTEQRFINQMFESLFAHRKALVEEKASENPPAYFALDICCVSPEHQGRGIARKLVEWGLKEAKNRGLESAMEASVMGQPVYRRAGYKPVAEIVWKVDDEFTDRSKPPNMFMRTGKIQ